MMDGERNKSTSGTESSMAMVRKSPMMDPGSPYYMTSAANPGVIITPVILKGDNYDEWIKAFRNALKAKKKLAFIDGRVVQPAKIDRDFDDWSTVNAMLVGWIFNTIDPSLRSGISYMENVKDLWEDLKERFFVDNDMRVYQLKSEISGFKQSGMILSAYYNRLKGMWYTLQQDS